MSICLNQVYYTHVTVIQEAIAIGLEKELTRFGDPDSYLVQTIDTLQKKRDEMCGVMREVGFTPIVPDGGYFVMVDTSVVEKEFDTTSPGQEAYDFQFAKWMMAEKV
jgi:kynurenine--oxoglutarate transaminase/cysteine-S-conjugate beta-lyase/glutamine--phenylpyruvate transaminase